MSYMKVLTTDQLRTARERARLKELINKLTADKIREEKAAGIERPVVKASELWPNLEQLANPKTYELMVVTGAIKQN